MLSEIESEDFGKKDSILVLGLSGRLSGGSFLR